MHVSVSYVWNVLNGMNVWQIDLQLNVAVNSRWLMMPPLIPHHS